MAVSYERAREILPGAFRIWRLNGTFCLDDRTIVENDEFYVFNIAAREFIVDGDVSFATAGGVSIVFKKDGRVEPRPSVMIATDPSIQSRTNPNPTLK